MHTSLTKLSDANKNLLFAAVITVFLMVSSILMSSDGRIFAVVDDQNGDAIWHIANVAKISQGLKEGRVSWWDVFRKNVYLKDFYYPFGRYLTSIDLDTSVVVGIAGFRLGKLLGVDSYSMAYNFPLFFHIALDIVVFYYVLRKLSIKWWLCLLGASLPLAFNFYAAVVNMGHLLYMGYWAVLLPVYFVAKLFTAENVDIKTSLLVALSFFLLVFTNITYTYFFILIGVPAFSAMLICILLMIRERRRYLGHMAANGLISVVALLLITVPFNFHRIYFPNWYMGIISYARMGFRPISDLQHYALDITSILTPGQMVYIGWSICAIFIFSIYWLTRNSSDNVFFRRIQRAVSTRGLLFPCLILVTIAMVDLTLYKDMRYFVVFLLVFVLLLFLGVSLYRFRVSQEFQEIKEYPNLKFCLLMASALLFLFGTLLASATSQSLFLKIFYLINSSARVYLRVIGMIVPFYILILVVLLDYFLRQVEKKAGSDDCGRPKSKLSYVMGSLILSVIFALIILDLEHPFNFNGHLSRFKMGQLFNEAHVYLRDQVPDIKEYSVADFSRLHTLAWGAYGGMLSSAFTGGIQGITLDCDDGRFINTFSSYGGKYLITDKTSNYCAEIFAKDSRIRQLYNFSDGSALMELRQTEGTLIDENHRGDAVTQEGFTNMPSAVLTNQVFYPMIAARGKLFKKYAVNLVTVGYKWRLCNPDCDRVVKEEQTTKMVWENPVFYYQDTGKTYLWFAGQKIYQSLQPNAGTGITTPGEAGTYELEISISNSINKNLKEDLDSGKIQADDLLARIYLRNFAAAPQEFQRSFRKKIEVQASR